MTWGCLSLGVGRLWARWRGLHIGVIPPSLVFSGWQKVSSTLPALPLLYFQKLVVQVQTFSEAAMLWRHHPCPALHIHLAGPTVFAVCTGTRKCREQVPNDKVVTRMRAHAADGSGEHVSLICCMCGEETIASVLC